MRDEPTEMGDGKRVGGWCDHHDDSSYNTVFDWLGRVSVPGVPDMGGRTGVVTSGPPCRGRAGAKHTG